jgi:hypothetical protein
MFRMLICSLSVAAVFAVAPAIAADTDCSDANLKTASDSLDKMPAGPKKTLAASEMKLAQDAFDKKDMATCKTHLTVVNYRISAGN